MPRRMQGGLDAHAVDEARRAAQAGDSAEMIFADLSSQFEELRSARLREIATMESESWQRLRTIGEMPWGLRGNIRDRLGCPAGSRIQANITIHWTDPETGIRRRFNHTAESMENRQVNRLVSELVADVVEKAREMGYRPPFGDSIRLNQMGDIEFKYLDCI